MFFRHHFSDYLFDHRGGYIEESSTFSEETPKKHLYRIPVRRKIANVNITPLNTASHILSFRFHVFILSNLTFSILSNLSLSTLLISRI